ncbi:MAG: hypothetical protein PUP93_34635 [Rhizonema sp. NSF051]|nr:hypothetical protein [Rhizonema sp. NSF051]
MANLNTVLEGLSDPHRQKVNDLVRIARINPKDPLFLILSSLGKYEILMEEIPDKLETVVKTWTVEIDNKLDKASSVALVQRHSAICASQQRFAIAKAAEALLKTGEQQKSIKVFGSVLPFAVLLPGIFGVCLLIGSIIPAWKGGGLTDPVRLTFEEKEALSWAKSKDGQFARQFMRWNDFDMNLCRQEPERLKGRCVLWVVPYDKRATYHKQLSK